MKQGTRLTSLGPLFPQQGHSVCFFKCTFQSSSTSGLHSAPGRCRQRLSRVEVPVLAAPCQLLPAPRLLPSAPRGWAQHQAPGTAHIHPLPGSHPDISAPPSRELLCCAPSTGSASHHPPALLPQNTLLLGWETSCSWLILCLIHETLAGTISPPDVL